MGVIASLPRTGLGPGPVAATIRDAPPPSMGTLGPTASADRAAARRGTATMT